MHAHIAWGERAKSNCYSPDTTQNKTKQQQNGPTGHKAGNLQLATRLRLLSMRLPHVVCIEK